MSGDVHDDETPTPAGDATPADLADEVSAWAAQLATTPAPDGGDDAADLAPGTEAAEDAGSESDAEPADDALEVEVADDAESDAEPADDAPAVEAAEPAAHADDAPQADVAEDQFELAAEPGVAGDDGAGDLAGATDSESAPTADGVATDAEAEAGEAGHPDLEEMVPSGTGQAEGEAFADGERHDPEPTPDLAAALEAVLMVVDEPIPTVQFAQVLETPRVEVEATLRRLAEEYTESGRGFDLREVAGGWRFYSRTECAPVVERFILDGQQARLTQAALETLAVIAYRQPVSRARVSAIRGVNCDGVVRTLVSRGLIEEAGTEQESNALLYRTTIMFLERLGLQSVDDLPDIAPYLPEVDEFTDTEDVPG